MSTARHIEPLTPTPTDAILAIKAVHPIRRRALGSIATLRYAAKASATGAPFEADESNDPDVLVATDGRLARERGGRRLRRGSARAVPSRGAPSAQVDAEGSGSRARSLRPFAASADGAMD